MTFFSLVSCGPWKILHKMLNFRGSAKHWPLGLQPDIVLMILFGLMYQTTARSPSRSLELIGIEWTYRTSEKMKTFLFLSSRFSFKWSKNKAKLSRDFLFLVCRLFILHAPKVLTFKFRTLWFLSIWRQLKFQAGTCWRLLLNSLLRTCELIEKCRTKRLKY